MDLSISVRDRWATALSSRRSSSLTPADLSSAIEHNLLRILPHLPVKSLLRFAVVDKEWMRTIYSRELKEKHMLLQKPNLVVDYRNRLLLYELESLKEEMEELDRPRIATDHHLLGTCNGIVCLVNGEEFLLWNPSILSGVRRVRLPVGGSDLTGFWMNFADDDFRLVSFHQDLDGRLNRCTVYDSRTGAWYPIGFNIDRIVKEPAHCSRFKPLSAVTVGDFSHWLVSEEEMAMEGDVAVGIKCWLSVLVFNFKNSELTFYELPDKAKDDLNYRASFLLDWEALGFIHLNPYEEVATLYTREGDNWNVKFNFTLSPDSVFTIYLVGTGEKGQKKESWALVLVDNGEDGGGFHLLWMKKCGGSRYVGSSSDDIVHVTDGFIPSLICC